MLKKTVLRLRGWPLVIKGAARGTRAISSLQSINFSESHVMLKNTCKDFVDNEILPKAHAIDKSSVYPGEIVKRMGELGLMGIDTAEKYGGAGLDYMSYAIAMEEVSRGCASCGVIMSAHNVGFKHCSPKN